MDRFDKLKRPCSLSIVVTWKISRTSRDMGICAYSSRLATDSSVTVRFTRVQSAPLSGVLSKSSLHQLSNQRDRQRTVGRKADCPFAGAVSLEFVSVHFDG